MIFGVTESVLRVCNGCLVLLIWNVVVAKGELT